MKKLLLFFILVFLSGCSACTSCFVDEVKQYGFTDAADRASINDLAIDFFSRELGTSKGIGADFKMQFRGETGNPEEYINAISDIFCPWE